ncbi:MAG: DNA mismatch repair protein MutS [Planctomycetes bacterium]|jgi:DNA mismatch repair protein MutS|nr:DNA mismatch repair protein MutS [Planctomycetota bacterium]MBT4029807.1 DNA mismatch repair protein MutS [Planctomycetota bacterium]MBT4559901.1 DNA mismatch repair protein MutS [Planctomycetota bacterium]MBT5100881.1 DNA mismatch repair protein MutS [Planctomycetota bacterium]MBT7012275.1 DNA mismatch repair protein MutS [Planctomycetota bacterium]
MASSKAKKRPEETPMMRQFHAAKNRYPHALLFFRMGDFYEMFFDDAHTAGKVLGLSVVSRSKEKEIPMAGVPVKSMPGYLVRLVQAGYTVAICEQMQDPREAKGIVDRDVVRVVSPGTLIEDENLSGDAPLFVMGVHLEQPRGRGAADLPSSEWPVGLAWADLTTGTFRCSSTTVAHFSEELARVLPAEVVFADYPESDARAEVILRLSEVVNREDISFTLRPSWGFDAERGTRDLCEQLKVSTLEAFGVAEQLEIVSACGGLLDFLKDTQKSSLSHFRDLQLHRASEHLVIDGATRRTLELTANQQDGSRAGTLLSVIDRTATPMGARLLREWLLEPLVDVVAIRSRHEAVGELVAASETRQALISQLDGLGDLERLSAKVAAGRSNARDLVGLGKALGRVPSLKSSLGGAIAARLIQLNGELDPCATVQQRLAATLVSSPPLALNEGGLVRDGYSAELDEYRELAAGGKAYLVQLQQRELERTGIPTLKVGFNRVFGYYIEVSRLQSDRVPDDYIRKQTLKNSERYITPELKEYEAKVLGAEEKAKELEYQIFSDLRGVVAKVVERLLMTASALARLDALNGLATVAVERRFVQPEFVDGEVELEIVGGRHPVVEAALLGDPFVPNNTSFGVDRRLAVLTGPNMSGKSTWLRQSALIVLMAQMGSFVPAESAKLSLVDRIFTRLGSGDDIARGQSTFMVEMVETANILRNATGRSLLLLDEVGRGTSTFDGLAIAWAVCEHVHNELGARCLFATHYHQLTDLAASLVNAVNLNVAVREWGDEIVFLHRIEEGGTDRSYGIHVAQLAGLPTGVLDRARNVLVRLERDEEDLSRRILQAVAEPDSPVAEKDAPAADELLVLQHSLFDLLANEDGDKALLDELNEMELNEVSPMDAWRTLDRVLRAIKSKS